MKVMRAIAVVCLLGTAVAAGPLDEAAWSVLRTKDRTEHRKLVAALVDGGRLTAKAGTRVPMPAELKLRVRQVAPEMREPVCHLVLDTGGDDVVMQCKSVVEAQCWFTTLRVATIRVGAKWSATDRAKAKEGNELCDQ